jgi:hypothetical protein
MTLNNAQQDDTSIGFDSHDRLVPAITLSNTRISIQSNYQRIIGAMLDAELDSDPQMSDSELSWQSVTDVDSLTATNHWRGWKQQVATIIHGNHSSTSTNFITMGHSSLTSVNEGSIRQTNPHE